jgi:DNA-directed RNA polymerase subunit F
MIKEVKIVSEIDVVDFLNKKSKKTELTYNEKLILEHDEALSKIGRKKEILNKLKKLLTEELAVKIADVMPKNRATIESLIKQNDIKDEKIIEEIMKIVSD